MYVFGPESHMTVICGIALGKKPIPKELSSSHETTTANFLLPSQTDNSSETATESVTAAEPSFSSLLTVSL